LVPKLKKSASGRAGDLDHCTDKDRQLAGELLRLLDFGDRLLGDPTEHGEFLHGPDERDHDFWLGIDLLVEAVDCRLGDRRDLHHQDLGIGDAEAAAAVAEHRVHLMELRDPLLDFGDRNSGGVAHFLLTLGVVRQEFVQRRVEQPDGDRQALHRFENSFEVAPLVGEELLERRFASRLLFREDHLAHVGDPLGIEEHMLGAAKADAFGTKRTGA
jgi:hypothetical protein